MIEYLAFSGGGMKGYAYIGVLKAMEEEPEKYKIKEIAGTSIGAFFGLMMNIGWKANELESIFMATNLAEHTDFSIKTLFEEYGLDDGSKLECFMETLLSKKGLHPHLTFAQLASSCHAAPIQLHVVVTNLNRQCRMVLNAVNTPDLRVVDAVKMSMALPVMFCPGTLNGHIIADGGLSNNLPVDLFQDKPKEAVLGFYLREDPPSSPVSIDSFADFMGAAMACTLRQVETCEWHRLNSIYAIVPVYSGPVGTVAPILSLEHKREAIKAGYDSFISFLQKEHRECCP